MHSRFTGLIGLVWFLIIKFLGICIRMHMQHWHTRLIGLYSEEGYTYVLKYFKNIKVQVAFCKSRTPIAICTNFRRHCTNLDVLSSHWSIHMIYGRYEGT